MVQEAAIKTIPNKKKCKRQNGCLRRAGGSVKVLHLICQKIWKTHYWPQDWKSSVFIPNPKKGSAKKAQTTAQLHSSHKLVK